MTQERHQNSSSQDLEAFPSTTTIFVGIWLLVFSALSVVGLYLAFLPDSLQNSLPAVGGDRARQVSESLVMMFAAGVGSTITTIMGYLLHASEKKDFDRAYTPWYFARPVMGMLLGLVFYFVLKGGLFVLTVGNSVSRAEELNLWSLSAVGALVGLFSKNAIEKLRELFNTLFKTQDQMNNELLNRLPDELKAQVSPYLEKSDSEPKKLPEGEAGVNQESDGNPHGA